MAPTPCILVAAPVREATRSDGEATKAKMEGGGGSRARVAQLMEVQQRYCKIKRHQGRLIRRLRRKSYATASLVWRKRANLKLARSRP